MFNFKFLPKKVLCRSAVTGDAIQLSAAVRHCQKRPLSNLKSRERVRTPLPDSKRSNKPYISQFRTSAVRPHHQRINDRLLSIVIIPSVLPSLPQVHKALLFYPIHDPKLIFVSGVSTHPPFSVVRLPI